MCGTVASSVIIVVGAVIIATVSLGGLIFIPTTVHNLVLDGILLKENTRQFNIFQHTPVPVQFNVRFFNITNKEEVMDGAVPVVHEVGPYIYNITSRRVIDEIGEDTIKYRQSSIYVFDTAASYPLTEDDVITMANMPYLSILQAAEQKIPFLMSAVKLGLEGVFGEYNSPIATFNVGEFLFRGVRLCANPGFFGTATCHQVRSTAGSSPSLKVDSDGSVLFAIFANKNGTLSEQYEIYRGFNNSRDLGQIISFNKENRLYNWVDYDVSPGSMNAHGYSVCNMLNGSDGRIFAPFVDREKPIYVFAQDICRSVDVRFEKETNYAGIPTLRFAANEWLLDNHQGCFCLATTPGITKSDGCLLPGVLELFSCYGAHLVMSYPHFLYADPVYQNGVIGLTPDPELHRIFIDMEPYTAAVLYGYKRVQFNMFLRPLNRIPATQGLRTTLTPMFWVGDGVKVDHTIIDLIQNALYTPLSILGILLPTLLMLGCIIFLIGVILLVRAKHQQQKYVVHNVRTILKNKHCKYFFCFTV